MFTGLIQSAKENPLKSMSATSGFIIALVAAVISVDGRYAHAADVDKANSQIEQQVQNSMQFLRRQMLEDKLFELDIRKAQSPKQQLSPVDQALRDRYQQQLNDLNAKNQQFNFNSGNNTHN